MPLPHFHIIPGLPFKFIYPAYFSFTAFLFSQFLMDIEPLIRIFFYSEKLHGFTNTIFGAIAVSLFSIWPGKFICELSHKIWNYRVPKDKSWLKIRSNIKLRAVIYGSIIGVSSHFILDAIMHPDISPFFPISDKNPFFGILSNKTLHQGLRGVLVILAFYILYTFTLKRKNKLYDLLKSIYIN